MRSAPPRAVVADTDPQHVAAVALGSGVDLDVDDGGVRVLGRVGQRLGHQVVGGHLDRLGQPPVDADGQLDRDGGAAGQGLERRAQPALGEDRRVDAAGQLAQLVQRAGQPGGQVAQLGGQLASLGRHRRLHRGLRGARLQGQGDQALLGAVVQIPLEASAGLVGGGHDPRPGGGQLRLRLGVRDCGGDQLGEAGQPGLGVRRQRLHLRGHRGHAPPTTGPRR